MTWESICVIYLLNFWIIRYMGYFVYWGQWFVQMCGYVPLVWISVKITLEQQHTNLSKWICACTLSRPSNNALETIGYSPNYTILKEHSILLGLCLVVNQNGILSGRNNNKSIKAKCRGIYREHAISHCADNYLAFNYNPLFPSYSPTKMLC